VPVRSLAVIDRSPESIQVSVCSKHLGGVWRKNQSMMRTKHPQGVTDLEDASCSHRLQWCGGMNRYSDRGCTLANPCGLTPLGTASGSGAFGSATSPVAGSTVNRCSVFPRPSGVEALARCEMA